MDATTLTFGVPTLHTEVPNNANLKFATTNIVTGTIVGSVLLLICIMGSLFYWAHQRVDNKKKQDVTTEGHDLEAFVPNDQQTSSTEVLITARSCSKESVPLSDQSCPSTNDISDSRDQNVQHRQLGHRGLSKSPEPSENPYGMTGDPGPSTNPGRSLTSSQPEASANRGRHRTKGDFSGAPSLLRVSSDVLLSDAKRLSTVDEDDNGEIGSPFHQVVSLTKISAGKVKRVNFQIGPASDDEDPPMKPTLRREDAFTEREGREVQKKPSDESVEIEEVSLTSDEDDEKPNRLSTSRK